VIIDYFPTVLEFWMGKDDFEQTEEQGLLSCPFLYYWVCQVVDLESLVYRFHSFEPSLIFCRTRLKEGFVILSQRSVESALEIVYTYKL